MLLQNGFALPEAISSRLGPLWTFLHSLGATTAAGGGSTFASTWFLIALSALVVFALPNTQEIVRGVTLIPMPLAQGTRRWLTWRPSTGWAIAIGVLFACGLLAVSRPTDFLYFQF